MDLLPFALLGARCTLYLNKVTPFEIMFGRPPPFCPQLEEGGLSEMTDQSVLQSLQSLQSVLKEAHAGIRTAHTGTETEVEPHPYKPGDLVWIRRYQVGNLEPCWKRQFTVTLTTPTAVKVEGIRAWIHEGHVK